MSKTRKFIVHLVLDATVGMIVAAIVVMISAVVRYANLDLIGNPNLFNNGLLPVGLNGKYGYIDTEGQLKIDYQYDFALPFSDGLAPVRSDDEMYFINTEGTVVSEKYDNALEFIDGVARVEPVSTQKFGLINEKFEYVVDPVYNFLYVNENNKMILADKDGSYGFIDKTGKTKIPFEYQHLSPFGENGLAFASKDGIYYGYINESGEFVIEPQYIRASVFSSDGLAYVDVIGEDGENAETCVINEKGEIIEHGGCKIYYIESLGPSYPIMYKMKERRCNELPVFDNYFTAYNTALDNYFIVQGGKSDSEPGKLSIIKKRPFSASYEHTARNYEFDKVSDFDLYGNMTVMISQKVGVLSKTGDMLIKPEYDKICNVSADGYYICRKNEQYYIGTAESGILDIGPFDNITAIVYDDCRDFDYVALGY